MTRNTANLKICFLFQPGFGTAGSGGLFGGNTASSSASGGLFGSSAKPFGASASTASGGFSFGGGSTGGSSLFGSTSKPVSVEAA